MDTNQGSTGDEDHHGQPKLQLQQQQQRQQLQLRDVNDTQRQHRNTLQELDDARQEISTLKKELSEAKQEISTLREREQQQRQQQQPLLASPATARSRQQLQSSTTASISSGGSCRTQDATVSTAAASSTAPTSSTASASTSASENRPAKRKRYSKREKMYLVRAEQNDGRNAAMILADQIGMPRPTARNILLRYEKEGESAMRDKRLETGGPAYHTKREPWHVEVLCDWLHWDATITLKALLEMLNVEIGRRILCEEHDKDCPTCAHLLAEEERIVGQPLRVNDYMKEACDRAREAYKKKFIRDERTIRTWLYENPVRYSRKVVVKQKSSANTVENMRKRLDYAKKLREYLRSGDKYYLIVMDEMPFYSTMSSTKGRSRKGERAVVLVPPASSMTHRLQAAMAVHPEHGLIYGETFRPARRSGKWSAQYGKEEFKKYLHGLFETLMTEENYDLRVNYAEEIKNKHIKIIWDNVPDHGSRLDAAKSEHGISKSIQPDNFDEFVSFAQERGATVQIVLAAPVSPHLNLCEFYNRVLRNYANAERTESEVRPALLNSSPRGQVIENRVSMLDEIVKGGMEKLKHERGPLTGCKVTMSKIMQRVIDKNGYLDWHWVIIEK